MSATPLEPERPDVPAAGPATTVPGTVGEHPTTPGGSRSGGDTASGTAQSARQEAERVGDTAGSAARDVASTTKEQGERVASDIRQQARRLTDETRGQVTEQAMSQRDRVVDGLRSLSEELRTMAGRSGEAGLGSDAARQGADAAGRVADYLAKREPGQLLDEVRGVARRRPGAFLLGAAALGVLAGRLSRGMIDVRREDSNAVPAADPSDPLSAPPRGATRM
jgi:hypothetical protein